MINLTATSELQAWIESRNGVYPSVDTWDIRLAGDDEVKTYPALIIEATGAEEHPVLRGVMAPLTIEVRLETIPEADGTAADATTEATHASDAQDLYNILADTDASAWITLRGTVSCFDIRGSEPTLETEDGRRSSTVQVRMTCCKA